MIIFFDRKLRFLIQKKIRYFSKDFGQSFNNSSLAKEYFRMFIVLGLEGRDVSQKIGHDLDESGCLLIEFPDLFTSITSIDNFLKHFFGVFHKIFPDYFLNVFYFFIKS